MFLDEVVFWALTVAAAGVACLSIAGGDRAYILAATVAMSIGSAYLAIRTQNLLRTHLTLRELDETKISDVD